MEPFVDFEHVDLANERFCLRSFIGPDFSDNGVWIAEYVVEGFEVRERLERMLASADWVRNESIKSAFCKATDCVAVVVKLNGITVTVARLNEQTDQK